MAGIPISIGDKFERLTVIRLIERKSGGQSRWLCKCSCGNEKVVWNTNLRTGRTKSCGCLEKETRGKHNLGKKRTEQTKIKMSVNSSQRKIPLEEIQKIKYQFHNGFATISELCKIYNVGKNTINRIVYETSPASKMYKTEIIDMPEINTPNDIRLLRRRLRMSMESLGKHLGITKQAVSLIELGNMSFEKYKNKIEELKALYQ